MKAFFLATVSAVALAACTTYREAIMCVDPGCETTNNIVVTD